jgi:general secretion pathway protein F
MMPMFRYRTVGPDGEIFRGDIEADSRDTAIKNLQRLGHIPVRVTSARKNLLATILIRRALEESGAKDRDITILTREIATLLGAGLPLEKVLYLLVEVSDKPSIQRLVSRLLNRIRQGATFTDALAASGGSFPQYYLGMVRAGEAGASLDTVLHRLADFMERSAVVRGEIRSALIYPMFLLITAGLSLFVMLTYVVPSFEPLFEQAGKELPLPTRIVIGVGTVFESYSWLIAIIMVGVAIGGRALLARRVWRIRCHRLLLRPPILGELLKSIAVARYSRTLATLLSNGVTMLTAVRLAGAVVGNSSIAASLEGLDSELKSGQGFARPLERLKQFPRMAIHLIRVGEESGQLEAMLFKVADIYDQEVQRRIKNLLALLVPVSTLGLGLIIAFFIVAILLAVFQVNALAFR